MEFAKIIYNICEGTYNLVICNFGSGLKSAFLPSYFKAPQLV